jgi:hypothetical protein
VKESEKRVSRKKIKLREKVEKSRDTVFFQCFVALESGGSNNRLAKAAGAEPFGGMRDQKLHAVVAQSRFGSENAKNTSGSERFWKLSSSKNARGYGAKSK